MLCIYRHINKKLIIYILLLFQKVFSIENIEQKIGLKDI